MTSARDEWRRFKEEVLARIEDFSVLFGGIEKQRPSGGDWVTALCPFHADREPSFGFNRKTGRWVCFAGCGKGGPIDFVMQSSGLPFKDVMPQLGAR